MPRRPVQIGSNTMRMVRLLRRAIALPAAERRDALVAAGALAYVSMALRIFPFSKAIAVGSVRVGHRHSDAAAIAIAIVRAVKRASYATPLRTVCIHEGLAAQLLLRRRGVSAILCYGTNVLNGDLKSHVWVTIGDEVILGEEEAPNYHLVATYPPPMESPTSRPLSSVKT